MSRSGHGRCKMGTSGCALMPHHRLDPAQCQCTDTASQSRGQSAGGFDAQSHHRYASIRQCRFHPGCRDRAAHYSVRRDAVVRNSRFAPLRLRLSRGVFYVSCGRDGLVGFVSAVVTSFEATPRSMRQIARRENCERRHRNPNAHAYSSFWMGGFLRELCRRYCRKSPQYLLTPLSQQPVCLHID